MPDSKPGRPSRARQAAVLLGAALPLVLFATVLLSEQLPAEVLAQSLVLDGAWKVLPGETAGGAELTLADAHAPTLSIPGPVARQGIAGSQHWLRRRFELPDRLLGRPLFLLMGDTRSGVGTVYV